MPFAHHIDRDPSSPTSSMEPLKWVVFAGPAGPSDSSEDGLQREAQTVLISRLEAPPSSRHEASGFIAQDAVLIETATPLKFTDKVKGICLPPVPGADVGEGIKEGQFCVTAGWEKMNGGNESMKKTVQHIALGAVHK